MASNLVNHSEPFVSAQASRKRPCSGIETVKPVHRPLRLDLGGSCLQAERLFREDLSLPIYPHLSAAAVRSVAWALS